MGVKGLAEGIILQSIEDLWDEDQRGECIAFFRGKEFRICAEVAGMNLMDQLKVLNLVKSVIDNDAKIAKDSLCQGGRIPSKTSKKVFRVLQAVT